MSPPHFDGGYAFKGRIPFVKVVQGIILSALWMPGLLAPAFAQTMEQSLYRQAHGPCVPMIRSNSASFGHA
jgi:hypothetical protein